MNKLNINLENCYGIAKLNTEFEFSNGSAKIIYAPNGCMKSSFAKTMSAISKGTKPEDEIFTDRETKYSVTIDGKDIVPKQILVFESNPEGYSSKDKMSTLLAKKELKDRYTAILDSIEKKKTELFKNIKSISSSSNAEMEINILLKKKTIFDSLDFIKKEVNEHVFEDVNFKYGEIINSKVQDFLKDNSILIGEYLKQYTALVSDSPFFEKGVFGTENANVITRSLSDNRFFDAHHKLTLKDGTIVNDTVGLEQIIKAEKERIFKDDALMKKFEKIDTAITKNADLKTFKRVIEANPGVLTTIINYETFKKQLWINYLSNFKESFNLLLNEYHESQAEINSIIKEANSQKTKWEEVVDLFNIRFDVPFKLKVLNQEDVILKDKTIPSISFIYNDGRSDGKGDLEIDENSSKLKAFSTGEQRALYLLNVIFEIKAKEEDGLKCLLIFDDIADSFDYKNKYAIIEYLKDISESSIFKMIILTHNFDFYRTVASRLPIIHRNDCFMTIKYDDEVKITPGNYLKNVFESWVKVLETNQTIFIASIPFARNLIEYIKGESDSNYLNLTDLLHIKANTKTITTTDLSIIYNTIWTNKTFAFPEKTVYNLIIEESEKIIIDTTETVQLESKIILSISIRLLAEEYMIKMISNKAAVSSIKTRQTTELMKLYKVEFPLNVDEIKLMEQVNLMSAENIHINAFMYEPILDLSDKHLKEIYKKIKILLYPEIVPVLLAATIMNGTPIN